MADSPLENRQAYGTHIVITLVHGTFAKRAKWTREGSVLRTHLAKSLPARVEFQRFEWSGRNRNADRKSAARRLGDLVSRRTLTDPEAHQFLIGHSHGGNVALYALDTPTREEAVSGVICFNTPFIATLHRNTLQLVFVVIIALTAALLPALLVGVEALQAATAWNETVMLIVSVSGILLIVFGFAFGLAESLESLIPIIGTPFDRWLIA